MTALNREAAGLDQSNDSTEEPDTKEPDQPDTEPVPVTEPDEGSS